MWNGVRGGLYIFLSIFHLYCTLKCSGQTTDYHYKHFGPEEGLPSSEIYDIIEDYRGFLWIASDRGLSRYNGYEFKNFGTEDKLTDLAIFKLHSDCYGKIWGLTFNSELFYFDPDSIQFHPYKFNHKIIEKGINSTINSFSVDSINQLHISYFRQQGYLKLDSLGRRSAINKPTHPAHCRIEIDFDKKFLFQNYRNGLDWTKIQTFEKKFAYDFCINDSIIEIIDTNWVNLLPGYQLFLNDCVYIILGNYVIELSNKPSIKKWKFSNLPISISHCNGEIWIGLLNGGCQSLSTGENLVNQHSVTRVINDFQGGLWISTLNKGLFYLKDKSINKLILKNSAHSNVADMILTTDESQLVRTTKNSWLISDLNKIKDTVVQNQRESIVVNVENGEYLLSRTHFLDLGHNKVFPINEFLYNIVENDLTVLSSLTRGHNLNPSKEFIGISPGGIISIKNRKDYEIIKFKFSRSPKAICKLPDQSFLIGLNNGLFNFSNGRLEAFSIPNYGAVTSRIESIYFANEKIIVNVFNKGIIIFDDSETIVIDKSKGLSSNVLNKLYPQNDTIFWASSSNGLNRIILSKQISIEVMNKSTGFPVNEIKSFSIGKTKIWCLTEEGISFFDKSRNSFNKKPINFSFDSLLVAGKKIRIQENLKLSSRDNNLEFYFTIINHQEAPSFNYRLDNGPWRKSLRRNVSFLSLTSGIHTLSISIGNQENTEFSFSFFINYPIWQRWWFIVLCMVVIALLIIAYFRRRNKLLIRENRLRESLMQMEIKTLKAQMNPHFIFNTLNSIQHFIIKQTKWEAQDYLVKFSRVIRKNLEYSNFQYVNLKEEMELLTDYIDLEKLRLEFDILTDVQINTNTPPQNLLIPPMIFQPFIENSIWHGLVPKGIPGKITLTIIEEQDRLNCTITDNGKGLKKVDFPRKRTDGAKSSLGTKITKERIQLHNIGITYDKKQPVKIENIDSTIAGESAGTKVTFVLKKVIG